MSGIKRTSNGTGLAGGLTAKSTQNAEGRDADERDDKNAGGKALASVPRHDGRNSWLGCLKAVVMRTIVRACRCREGRLEIEHRTRNGRPQRKGTQGGGEEQLKTETPVCQKQSPSTKDQVRARRPLNNQIADNRPKKTPVHWPPLSDGEVIHSRCLVGLLCTSRGDVVQVCLNVVR